MKYTKKSAVSIITASAKEYDKYLNGYELLFGVNEKGTKKISTVKVIFTKGNYLHLTGIKLLPAKRSDGKNRPLTADEFFERCLSGTLGYNDFEIPADGTVELKLDVLPYIMKKDLCARMVADYKGDSLKLQTDKLIGGVKACIGCRKINSEKYIPNTLLNCDIREKGHRCGEIVFILKKHIEEKEYSERIFKSHLLETRDLQFPKEYECVLQ